MSPSKPVYYTTPDGVERLVRFTFGARKRIVDRFGMPLVPALNKYDSGALPELLYACMFDEDGKPPEGLNLERFIENTDSEAGARMMAALMSAASEGRAEKNELEALIRDRMQKEVEKLTGFTSGPLPISVSDSAFENSGGVPTESSLPSATDTKRSEDLTITAPA